MAEPDSLPPEDRANIRPDTPDLRALEGIDGHNNSSRSGFYNPHDDNLFTAPTTKSLNPSDLAAAESASGLSSSSSKQAGPSFYNPIEKLSPTAKVKTFFGIKRRRALIGGGVGGGIIALIVGGFFLLIPLKIEDIVTNLQDHFSSSTNDAVDGETQNLFSSYITKYVLPSYKSCGTTADRHCYVGNVLGSDPVSNLYHAWAQARIEQKLAGPPYNIEFSYERKANVWHIITPSTGEDGEDIGKDGEKLDTVLASRADVRAAALESISDETFSKQILLRYKIDRLLSEKYGIRWCTVFCGVTDPIHNSIADQKIAAQLFLVQKVIQPRDTALGVALQCIFSKDCDATANTKPAPCTPDVDCEEGGAPKDPETDTALQNQLLDLAGENSDVTADELLAKYNAVKEAGFQNYMVAQAVGKIVSIAGGDEAAQASAQEATSNALPVIGWANFVAQMIHKSGDLGPDMKKMAYLTNVTAAVSLWSMYESYADEIHTGHVTATEVGSFTDSLGPGGSSTPNDPELGGTADATQTPLYQSLMGDSSGNSTATTSSSVSLLNDLFPSAYADSTNTTSSSGSTSYLCNNGEPVPAGKLVCPEEVLGGGNSFLNSVSSTLSSSGLTTVANVWNDSIGAVYNSVFSLVGFVVNPLVQGATTVLDAGCSLPIQPDAPYCLVKSGISTEAPKIMKTAVNDVIPDPISDNMSGGRTFDMMAAGADASNNDYAHEGLGGEALTPTQTAELTNQQETEAQQSFSKQPIFARLFSTDSPYSLVSKLAVDMPSSLQSTEASFASILSDPFASLTHGFASIFSDKVSAQAQPQADPFGITQYGYPDGTIPTDPEAYWTANCSDNPSQAYENNNNWNQAASQTLDPNTGMPENTTTNPCLLIMATTGADGGYYNSSLLTSDDLANVDNSP